MQRNFYRIFSVLVLSVFLFGGCSNKIIDKDNVIQLDNVGLRKGVFERRFRLSEDFGKNSQFSSAILKNFIQKVFLPEYLFIQKAYELNFDKDPVIQKNMLEFRMNALSSIHPIRGKEIFIKDNELDEYLAKKNYSYNFILISHPSYLECEKLAVDLRNGIDVETEDEMKKMQFPKVATLKDKTYGQSVPIDIYYHLKDLKIGEVSKPIYKAPFWSVIKLLDKKRIKDSINKNIEKKSLINEFHLIKKDQEIQAFVDKLKLKYNCKININSKKILNAFSTDGKIGYFDSKKYEGSLTSDFIIETNKQNITADMFFTTFNRSNRFSNMVQISEQDIKVFIEDLSAQLVLYLDALEKNLDEDGIIKDQIENKINRYLYQKFLKEEISDKVEFSVEEARVYYHKNRDVWKGEFEKVKGSIINKNRTKLIYQLKDELIEKFTNEYDIIYNEELLNELSAKFTNERNNNSIK